MDLDVKVPEVVVVRNGANPGDSVVVQRLGQMGPHKGGGGYEGLTHGSAISLSVSLMILFGSAMVKETA